MAAIDKFYVKNFYDYQDVKLWALVYYPKLLLCFYDLNFTSKQYHKNKGEWVRDAIVAYTKNYARLGKFTTEEEAIQNLIKHYKQITTALTNKQKMKFWIASNNTI